MGLDIKYCSRCKEEKPFVEFGKDSSRKDKLNPWCKSCKSNHYHNNNGFEIMKKSSLKINYNITLEELNEMAYMQDNKCLICEQEKPLVIDHSHTTGKVRGLLCNNCNRGIGMLGDSKRNLKNALKYLKDND